MKETNPISHPYKDLEWGDGGNSTTGGTSSMLGGKKAERVAIGGSTGKGSSYGPDRGCGGNSTKETSYSEKHGSKMSGKVGSASATDGSERPSESGNQPSTDHGGTKLRVPNFHK